MGFKRTRNGEQQRDRETAENEEVVEVETGNNDTTQDQTQTEQRAGAERGIHALPDKIGNLAGYFLPPTPPARRAVSEERMRTKTPGKQVKLSAMCIDTTPVDQGRQMRRKREHTS
jgi:hypothetical protein